MAECLGCWTCNPDFRVHNPRAGVVYLGSPESNSSVRLVKSQLIRPLPVRCCDDFERFVSGRFVSLSLKRNNPGCLNFRKIKAKRRTINKELFCYGSSQYFSLTKAFRNTADGKSVYPQGGWGGYTSSRTQGCVSRRSRLNDRSVKNYFTCVISLLEIQFSLILKAKLSCKPVILNYKLTPINNRRVTGFFRKGPGPVFGQLPVRS